jgi:hypothetical protein
VFPRSKVAVHAALIPNRLIIGAVDTVILVKGFLIGWVLSDEVRRFLLA